MELKQCQENLEDYRAHLVQKFDEAEFDSEFYNQIGNDECIVIWDYKMKILAAFYREAQKNTLQNMDLVCLGLWFFSLLQTKRKSSRSRYTFFF